MLECENNLILALFHSIIWWRSIKIYLFHRMWHHRMQDFWADSDEPVDLPTILWWHSSRRRMKWPVVGRTFRIDWLIDWLLEWIEWLLQVDRLQVAGKRTTQMLMLTRCLMQCNAYVMYVAKRVRVLLVKRHTDRQTVRPRPYTPLYSLLLLISTFSHSIDGKE